MQSDRRDFVVGEFRVSPMLNRIRSADKIITVKPKSMAVLERLAETPGQVVSRNDIMDRVWPGAAVTDDVLTQSIAELRRAFGDDARSPTFIETIPKVGVRLVAATGPWSNKEASPGRRKPIFAAAIVGAVSLLIATAWLASDRASSPDANTNTIAVLPFANMSGDPELTYISDGMSEEILNVLAQVPQLSVIARTSSFQYRGDGIDVRQIGDELSVAWVLEGSLRTSDNVMRVTAQLINTRDGFHAWSYVYDRDFDDILKLQDEIAAAVVDELRHHVNLNSLSAIATGRLKASNKAYDQYMRGLEELNRIFAPGQQDTNLEAPGRALEHFRRASEIAPQFAPAWAWRAIALDWHVSLNGISDDGATVAMGEFVDRALTLAPELAEVQFVAGWYQAFWVEDLRTGLEHFDRAVEINPNYAAAHSERSTIYLALGRYRDYFESAETAVNLNPLEQWAHYDAMYARFYQGKLDNVERDIGREQNLWPRANALVDEAHLRFELGQLEHFPTLHRRADALTPDFGLEPPDWITSAPRHFGGAYLALGLPDRARRFMAGRYDDVLDLYAGRHGKAIAHLEAEMENGKNQATFYYRWFPDIVASLAEAYLYAGRYDELADMKRWLPDWTPELWPLPRPEFVNPPWPKVAYTYALFQTDRIVEAESWLDATATSLEDRFQQGINAPNHYYELARIRVMQGRVDEAFTALERAIDMGWRRWYFDRDPILQPIRELPGFADLQARYDADIARMRAAVLADLAANGPEPEGSGSTTP